MKFVDLENLSTITHIESHPFNVFGKFITESIEMVSYSIIKLQNLIKHLTILLEFKDFSFYPSFIYSIKK